MRTMISDILAQAGFEVVGEAETGLQAIERYKELKPDLVTMDIVMPDMGGIDAVREIVKGDPNAQVLMCSAMGQQALVVEAIQAGAKDFVVKPFQPSRVLEAVARVPAGRRAQLAQPSGERPAGARASAARPRVSEAGRPAAARAPGGLVRVVLRAEASLRGARALLALKKAEPSGTVGAVRPAPA